MDKFDINNIPQEKFVLVNENKKLHDKELVTKPVGFFKDALHRFTRNKGSIVATFIIGILVLFAIIAPIFSDYTVSYKDPYYSYTLPKLFTNIDFIDGCSEKYVNERTFLYYYSMGAETGHNAVKRQEYEVNEVSEGTSSKMYTFRQDSYQMNGVVFKTLKMDEYQAIQDYQDANNVQIIYPITDPEKRPQLVENKNDANYWFETVKAADGKTSPNPDTTLFNEDGSITFKNIYLPYKEGRMKSTQSIKEAVYIKLLKKTDASTKYVIAFANVDGVYTNYISIETAENTDSVYLTNDLEEACEFDYDTTHNCFTTVINGHDDPSLDGEYFFGIGDQGSSLNIVKSNESNHQTYYSFGSFDLDGNLVNPSYDTEFIMGTSKTLTKSTSLFLTTFNSMEKVFKTNKTYSSSGAINLVEKTGGYALKVSLSAKIKNFLNITVNGDKNEMSVSAGDTAANIWSFDTSKSILKTTLSGHSTPSLDGDYTFGLRLNKNKESVFELIKVDEIDNKNVFPMHLVTDSNAAPVTEIDTTKTYCIGAKVSYDVFTDYYANGLFEGDNYTSKMRIEGEDEYLYSYAIQTGKTYNVRINYYEYYKYYHKEVAKDKITEPFFIFGTTNNGQDIFTCLASGARFSFIMSIVVASVNLIVGAIYGAIEGYYGGKVDLIMERIVEILSAVPFMIVITLLKYHMPGNSQVLILFIAFFLTGWIGMSGTVRMQFYRFKNQEYVLASRTLGANDWRIMWKHIFPNSLGTIVTSCVLVIPGMIFSETSLSYLGIINLNSGSMTSVGTLLAAGQPYLVQFPHMIVYPAVFISLLELSFNLFGNGLRDAFNPSLRGTED